jgi:hypothetical protein
MCRDSKIKQEEYMIESKGAKAKDIETFLNKADIYFASVA